MLETFLNQKATYWIGTSDGYGGYNWSKPYTIDVRWQQKREITRDSNGEEVVSNDQIWMYEKLPFKSKKIRMIQGIVNVDNPYHVNSFEVIDRSTRVDIDGNIDGYKVWL